MNRTIMWEIVIGVFIVTGIIVAFLLYPLAQNQPLPIIKKAPPFTLVNQDNQTVSLEDFSGMVILLEFMYTSCQDTYCPTMVKDFGYIQEEFDHVLGIEAILLSITLDPLWDTPERLKQYGIDQGANFTKWQFLTAYDEETISEIIENYGVISYSKEFSDLINTSENNSSASVSIKLNHSNETQPKDLIHSWVIMLIDKDLMIRKVYTSVSWIVSVAINDLRGLL